VGKNCFLIDPPGILPTGVAVIEGADSASIDCDGQCADQAERFIMRCWT
jgi:hypothetical protein